MDKRLIIAVLAVLLAMATATAKRYYDPSTGYSVTVVYQGSSKKGVSLEAVRNRELDNWTNAGGRVNHFDGLTEELNLLVWKSIWKYDYSVGDIFLINMVKPGFGNIVFFTEIISTGSGGGRFTYDYYAYYIY